jgi:Fur family ferric uptake transcriptional regulator
MSVRPATSVGSAPWDTVPERLRARGLRWTPQRRVLVDVLSSASGHVTGSELVERCRAVDPGTVPSTVYRTLSVLEELGLVRHSHGHDGREEYHVLPEAEHGHLHCTRCGRTWELPLAEAEAFVGGLWATRGFEVEVSHLSVGGLCPDCRAARRGRDGRHAHPAANLAASIRNRRAELRER